MLTSLCEGSNPHVLVLVLIILIQVVLVLVLVRPMSRVLWSVASLLIGVLVTEVLWLVAHGHLVGVAGVLSRLGLRLLHRSGGFQDFRFLRFLLLHALPSSLVEDEDSALLLAHARGLHALLAARDVVRRSKATAPGVVAILTASAGRETHTAWDTVSVALTLILFIVT